MVEIGAVILVNKDGKVGKSSKIFKFQLFNFQKKVKKIKSKPSGLKKTFFKYETL